MRALQLALAFVFASSQISLAQINSIADGIFHDSTTWDCNCIPNSNQTLNVNHNITLTSDFDPTWAPDINISDSASIVGLPGTKLDVRIIENEGVLDVPSVACLEMKNYGTLNAVGFLGMATFDNYAGGDANINLIFQNSAQTNGLENYAGATLIFDSCDMVGSLRNSGDLSGNWLYCWPTPGLNESENTGSIIVEDLHFEDGGIRNEGYVYAQDFYSFGTFRNNETGYFYVPGEFRAVKRNAGTYNYGVIEVGDDLTIISTTMGGDGRICVLGESGVDADFTGAMEFCDHSSATGAPDGGSGVMGPDVTLCSVPCVVSVDEPSKALSVSAFPNPVNDVLTIELADAVAGHYMLTDALGRTVHQGSFGDGTTQFSLAGWPSGVYFLTVNSGISMRTLKVMKQ